MKVIVVSFFPGDDNGGSGIGGFDWYPDDALGCERARAHAQVLMGAPEYRTFPDTCVTVRRLEVPVDPTVNGWRDAVTQWLDEHAELRELPSQSPPSSKRSRLLKEDGYPRDLVYTGELGESFWIKIYGPNGAEGHVRIMPGHDSLDIDVTGVVQYGDLTPEMSPGEPFLSTSCAWVDLHTKAEEAASKS